MVAGKRRANSSRENGRSRRIAKSTFQPVSVSIALNWDRRSSAARPSPTCHPIARNPSQIRPICSGVGSMTMSMPWVTRVSPCRALATEPDTMCGTSAASSNDTTAASVEEAHDSGLSEVVLACRARCRPRAGSGTSAARWRVRSPSGRPRAFQRTPHDSISPIWQTATNSSCRNAERQARRPAVARVLDAGWFTKPALPMTASVAHPAHRHPSEVDRSRCSAIPNCGTSCDGLARQRRSGGRGCWSVARPDHRSRT